jgi:hypothetical protein
MSRPFTPLPLEARRRLWDRLWDRLLQPCPDERDSVKEPTGASVIDEQGASIAFDASRMAWGNEPSATRRGHHDRGLPALAVPVSSVADAGASPDREDGR